MVEHNIKVWNVVDGETLEIKLNDVVYVPVGGKEFINFDGRLWKPKKNSVSTNLGKTYNKQSKYNMQNHFLKWLSTKDKDFDFTMSEFFNETGAYRTRPKRYDHYLRSLDDDGYLEAIHTPGCQTRYFVRKRLKKR